MAKNDKKTSKMGEMIISNNHVLSPEEIENDGMYCEVIPPVSLNLNATNPITVAEDGANFEPNVSRITQVPPLVIDNSQIVNNNQYSSSFTMDNSFNYNPHQTNHNAGYYPNNT